MFKLDSPIMNFLSKMSDLVILNFLIVVCSLPIFTMGKYFERDGRRMLPLSIQVHHAVCDGYHVGVFVDKLQDKINSFAE